MNLLINGMDMPKLGENGDHLWVPSWIEVGKDGKAIICTGTHFDPNTIRSYATEEVPTPHGDLIDRDDLLAYFEKESKGKEEVGRDGDEVHYREHLSNGMTVDRYTREG